MTTGDGVRGMINKQILNVYFCIMYVEYIMRPHDIIHPPPSFWGLAGITGANGSSWN